MSVINTNTNTETIDFDQSTSSSSSSISAASYNRQLSSQFKQNQHPQMAFINPQQPQFNGQFTHQNQNLPLDQFDYQQVSDSQPIKLTISPYHPLIQYQIRLLSMTQMFIYQTLFHLYNMFQRRIFTNYPMRPTIR